MLATKLNISSTDEHQHLHFTSSHSGHIKGSIIYIQILSLCKICKFESHYIRHEHLQVYFTVRSRENSVII